MNERQTYPAPLGSRTMAIHVITDADGVVKAVPATTRMRRWLDANPDAVVLHDTVALHEAPHAAHYLWLGPNGQWDTCHYLGTPLKKYLPVFAITSLFTSVVEKVACGPCSRMADDPRRAGSFPVVLREWDEDMKLEWSKHRCELETLTWEERMEKMREEGR